MFELFFVNFIQPGAQPLRPEFKGILCSRQFVHAFLLSARSPVNPGSNALVGLRIKKLKLHADFPAPSALSRNSALYGANRQAYRQYRRYRVDSPVRQFHVRYCHPESHNISTGLGNQRIGATQSIYHVPVKCVSQTAYERCDCPDDQTCGLRMVMFKVRNAIADILDNTSLADVVGQVKSAQAQKLAQAFGPGNLINTKNTIPNDKGE